MDQLIWFCNAKVVMLDNWTIGYYVFFFKSDSYIAPDLLECQFINLRRWTYGHFLSLPVYTQFAPHVAPNTKNRRWSHRMKP